MSGANLIGQVVGDTIEEFMRWIAYLPEDTAAWVLGELALPKRKRRGAIIPEGRRRLSLAMKKRWAERRKKGF
jgi:hypothetical protein